MDAQKEYIIPARFRKMENTHILFWLLKDISWCLTLKWLGIAMIVPTLAIAGVIAWRTRKIVSELSHNLAISFWICANSFWMATEFFGVDEHLKPYALIPFFLGLVPLIYYYGIYSVRKYWKRKAELVQSGNKALPIDGDVAEGTRTRG
jgi:hypothetical protein